jgi:hypothetical protein
MTHDDRSKSKQVPSKPDESPKVMEKGRPFGIAQDNEKTCRIVCNDVVPCPDMPGGKVCKEQQF